MTGMRLWMGAGGLGHTQTLLTSELFACVEGSGPLRRENEMTVQQWERWERDGFLLTTDPNAIDLEVLHAFLQQAYWSRGIPMEVVRQAVAHSLPFSLLHLQDPTHFVGFARVITDAATFAYLSDVFVLPPYRGRGLGTWMLSCVLAHPHLQGLRRWCLGTRDAQALYARVGFAPLAAPERWMERVDPQVYERGSAQEPQP
jgi:GNAT superfamily N-acetyltransferase